VIRNIGFLDSGNIWTVRPKLQEKINFAILNTGITLINGCANVAYTSYAIIK
jgi:hypothetical protein